MEPNFYWHKGALFLIVFVTLSLQMHKENKFTRIIIVAMIGLFVNFMFANTIFVHTHKLADGSVVCHSHPYQHSGTHSHSATSLSLISTLNNTATSFLGTAMLVLAVLASIRIFLYLSAPQQWTNAASSSTHLRAPPVLNWNTSC